MIDIEKFKNKILTGESSEIMEEFPENSIDLTITSCPYDNIRDYKGYSFPFSKIAQQLFRTTKKGGVVVWVVGDAVINKSESGTSFKQALYFMSLGFFLHDTMIYEKNGPSFPARRDSNRYSQVFEYMFVFSKLAPPKTAHLLCDRENRWAGFTTFGKASYRNKAGELIKRDIKPIPQFSPRFNIWKYNTGKGYSTKDAIAFGHPAIFPEKLVEDHLLTWSEEGDIVLDPFSGSGTTAKIALLNKRNFIGIDVCEEYNAIAKQRIFGIE